MLNTDFSKEKQQIQETQNATQLRELLASSEFESSTYGKHVYRHLPKRSDQEAVIQRTHSYSDLENQRKDFKNRIVKFDSIHESRNFYINPLKDLEKTVAEFAIILKQVVGFNERSVTLVSKPYRCDFNFLKSQSLALLEMLQEVEIRNIRFMNME